jgi:heat shock protein HslJ
MNKIVIALIALVAIAGAIGGALLWGNGSSAAANGAESSDLAGTSWVLEQINDAAGARPAANGSQPTLDFGTDGRVTGNATCNRFFGPYTQDGATLSVGMLASTMMACTDESWNEQEQAYMAALGAAEQAQIVGDTLVISGADGVELRFTRA